MKKLISVLLALIMVCGTMTIGFTTALAAETQSEAVADDVNPVVSIEVLDDFAVTYQEGVNGYVTSYFDSDIGEEKQFFYYEYEYDQVSKAKFLLTYKDSSTRTVSINEEIDGYSIHITEDQYSDPWLPNKYNYMMVFFGELETKLPVVIIPSPVKNLEVVTPMEKEFVENTDGYYNSDVFCNEAFFYNILPSDLETVDIKINFKDGTSKMAKIGEYINGELLDYNDNQYVEPWKPGKTNYITIIYMDKHIDMPVKFAGYQTIGDINNDGLVDILDAIEIQKFAAEKITMTGEQKELADVNNDGFVDVLDAAEIQKFAAGIITEFTKTA